MYCPKCGKQVEQNDLFCKHCGCKLGGNGTTNRNQNENKNYHSTNTNINFNNRSFKDGDVIRALNSAYKNGVMDSVDVRIYAREVIRINKTKNYSLMKTIYSIIDSYKNGVMDSVDARINISQAIRNVK